MTPDPMRARERDWAIAVKQDLGLLNQIAGVVSGPYHLIHPETFTGNLYAFQQVLQKRAVPGHVYYGKKANKAGAWLRELACLDASVDVASLPEFTHALANGITGERIGVTGAAKSDDLLWLATRHGAVVAIDALDELTRAIRIARDTGSLRVLLRVLPPNAPDSRFGLSPADLSVALNLCVEAGPLLDMEGFSFHLDGYEVAPRADLAKLLLDSCRKARARGLSCRAISIGGGFACSYVDAKVWRDFQANIDTEQFHSGRHFSKFYPYHQTPTGEYMLDAILQSPSGSEHTLADALRDAGISLYLEPGRALLDGAGLSVFPVQGFKRNDAHGIVTVAGLSMSLSEQWKNSEFLPSPALMQCGPPRPQTPVAAAVGGSSCMEYDVLSWRKIRFPAEPRAGDLIVYPNTAGYQMDKNESTFHQLPLPPKVVLSGAPGAFSWCMDQ